MNRFREQESVAVPSDDAIERIQKTRISARIKT